VTDARCSGWWRTVLRSK